MERGASPGYELLLLCDPLPIHRDWSWYVLICEFVPLANQAAQ